MIIAVSVLVYLLVAGLWFVRCHRSLAYEREMLTATAGPGTLGYDEWRFTRRNEELAEKNGFKITYGFLWPVTAPVAVAVWPLYAAHRAAAARGRAAARAELRAEEVTSG